MIREPSRSCRCRAKPDYAALGATLWPVGSPESGDLDMAQLSSAQVAMLEQIWTELWVGQRPASPPITDEELAREILDSWLAGVLSSNGRISEGALRDLLAFQSGHPVTVRLHPATHFADEADQVSRGREDRPRSDRAA